MSYDQRAMTAAAEQPDVSRRLVVRVLRWLSVGPDTAAALVLANLVPLVGVVAFGWSVMTILVVYWLESGVIGLLNIPKLAMARGAVEVQAGEARLSFPILTGGLSRVLALAFAIPFFVVHYGIFWFGHGLVVFLLPAMARAASAPDLAEATDPFALAGVEPSVVLSAAGVLLVSHLVSFWRNFVRRREYLRVSPTAQMAAPYGRVIVMHLTILAGGFLSLAIGSPIGALVILVVLKTALDLRAHLRAHAEAQPGSGPSDRDGSGPSRR